MRKPRINVHYTVMSFLEIDCEISRILWSPPRLLPILRVWLIFILVAVLRAGPTLLSIEPFFLLSSAFRDRLWEGARLERRRNLE